MVVYLAVKSTIEEASGVRPILSGRPVAASVFRPGALLAGLGVAGLAFLLYLRTLAPTVLYYERPDLIDSAMFQTQAYILGITHPTGYPTYLMLAHLFTYLPFGDPAYRVNLASAVFGAAAVFLVFLTALKLSGRITAAVAGSLAFAAGNTFWSQAIVAEVYTLNAAFVALVLLVLFLWRETRKDRYLLAAAFLMGLSLTNHITSGLLLPAAVLFVRAVDRRKLRERRLVLKGAGLFVLGLAPYLYLPVRGSMEPQIREADPTSLLRFLEFIVGREFAGQLVQLGPGTIPSRFALFWGYLWDEFHAGLLLVAIVGAVVLYRRDRASALLLAVLFLGWLVFAVQYDIFDFFLYFIPLYLLLALLMAAGVGAILAGAGRLAAGSSLLVRVAPILLFVLLSYFAVSDVQRDYPLVDRGQDSEGRRLLEAVSEKTAPNATVLHHRSPLWYMVLVEEHRRDLALISPWYPSRNPTRTWSGPNGPRPEILVAPSLGNTGAIEAKEAARRGGPVYALKGSVDLNDFRTAGFSIVTVEKDLLYELVPPGRTPYTTLEEQQD